MKLKVFLTLMLSCVLFAITLILDPHHFVLWGLITSVSSVFVLYWVDKAERKRIMDEINRL